MSLLRSHAALSGLCPANRAHCHPLAVVDRLEVRMSQKGSAGEFVDYAEKLDLVRIVTLSFSYTNVLVGYIKIIIIDYYYYYQN